MVNKHFRNTGQNGVYPAPLDDAGFTLAEILIVVALIIVLMLVVLVNLRGQINKGYDAERKADLYKIQKAFNEYYNDHGCYPPLTILNACGGNQLAPYLPAVPCDPQTKQPYLYQPYDPTNLCAGYRILAGLFDLSDPAITQVGCSSSAGCGYGVLYNWGVSEGGPVPTGVVVVATPTPTPYSSPQPGQYACAPGGFCKVYADPQGAGCPVTYADRNCLFQCGNSSNWCRY